MRSTDKKGSVRSLDRFRATLRDSLAKGVPLQDAIAKGVADAQRPVVDAALRSRFRDSLRDAASRGLSAKDALARAFGAGPRR
jgi:hypothetical protein